VIHRSQCEGKPEPESAIAQLDASQHLEVNGYLFLRPNISDCEIHDPIAVLPGKYGQRTAGYALFVGLHGLGSLSEFRMRLKAVAGDTKSAQGPGPWQRKRVDYFQGSLFIGLKHMLHKQASTGRQHLTGQPQPLHGEAKRISGGRRNGRETRSCAAHLVPCSFPVVPLSTGCT
jgi:hypothetical protein